MIGRTRVALALGSGGARGYAHIGAIQVIEERGLEIVGVSGASMGALVGGVYAAGKLDAYTEWALSLSQLDMVRLLDVSVTAPGAIHAEKVLNKVREMLGDAVIEDLAIPFTAVATDLAAGRSVWFQRGPVDVAIRASIAIPGVITPYVLNGRVLADGGILAPLPIAPTVGVPSDLTIGISLGADEPGIASPENVSSEPRPMEEWMGRFRRSAAQVFDTDLVRSVVNRFGSAPAGDDTTFVDESLEESPGENPEETLDTSDGLGPMSAPKFGRVAVMNRSLDIMQSALSRFQLAAYPPDVLVEVPRTACRSLDFHKAADMIALGRSLTETALDAAGYPAPGNGAPEPANSEGSPA
ncbi:patatin-like phospholipase family protein [Rhodococcus chondri]|uniref:Patatin-like phospholipase family protein n=1 Tax=Rhodococcus chondri TaxID=3065941 RepID=A0ABU7JZD0_9NOCA|nr:patatin-like phospholipase family protein [Rhodococcus sp. CC-R104]MEE2035167.1 patatin-like phospholipase family protein [Rhodococcus sp. CC-R104]